MWKDMLVIAAFVLAGLTYFGLTPRKLATYAKTAEGEITKRSVYQRVFLIVVIASTVFGISVVIWRFETIELWSLLVGIAVCIILWCDTLSDVWKLSKRGEKVVDIVAGSVILPLFVVAIILSDMLLWQKLAYPLGGVGIGFGLHRLADYIGAKRTSARSPKEGDK